MDIITLALAKKYADEKLTNIDSSSAQSDWEQNDENAVDYIKNKPFGDTGEYEEIELLKDGLVWYTGVDQSFNILRECPPLKANCNYKITVNGKEYNCTSKNVNSYIALGQSNYVTTKEWEEDKEPFVFLSTGGMAFCYIREGVASGNFYISISEYKPIIKLLDRKYIEDYLVGQKTTGQEYTYENEVYTSQTGAEIFNSSANIAIGLYSHAEGNGSVALGDYSHAEGNGRAIGMNSHAEGGSKAIGSYAHAEGALTEAVGKYAHAEGLGTEALRDLSHVEGWYNIANTNCLHVQGCYNIPEENPKLYNYIWGLGQNIKYDGETIIYIYNSRPSLNKTTGVITAGEVTECTFKELKAGDNFSFTNNANSIIESFSNALTFIGTEIDSETNSTLYSWTIKDLSAITSTGPGKYLHIVGNGTYDKRSNAHTLETDGTAWFASDVYVGSTSGVNRDEGSKKLATEDFVNEQVSNLIIVSKIGTSIVSTDSSDNPLKGLKTFGKSTQRTTTGKNLLQNTAKSQTISGVTFTVNNDGSITANGTATDNIQFTLKKGYETNGNEILSGCKGGSEKSYRLQYYDYNPSTFSFNCYDDEIEIPSGKKGDVRIYIVSETILNNIKFYPMIRDTSITDSTFEPYTGGIPAPNPEYPQLIESVGDDGSVEVGVYGGNLFDKNDESMRSHAYINMTATTLGFAEDANDYSVVLKVNPNIEYTIYCQNCTRLRACTTSELLPEIVGEDVSTNVTGVQRDGNTSLTINSGSDGNYLYVNLSETEEAFTQALQTLIVSVGTKVLPYELYKPKQSLTIPTQNGLPGIPVTDASLATYTDENGQMWCADEVDFERGVYVKRIKDFYLNKSNYVTMSVNKDFCRFYFSTRILFDTDTYISRTIPIISNKLIYSYNAINGCYQGTISNDGWKGNSRIVVQVPTSVDTIDKFMEYMGEDCVVKCIIAEPIETPLTEEELSTYKKLTMNYPTTTILNDANAYMEVKYSADTQNHIEQNYVPKSAYTALEARVATLEKNAL